MSDENVIFMDFFAVKVDGSDVIAGISLYEDLFTDFYVAAMSRIARLLSYHSFGAKNSLERQKKPVLMAFQLLLVSHIKLTSSSSKL